MHINDESSDSKDEEDEEDAMPVSDNDEESMDEAGDKKREESENEMDDNNITIKIWVHLPFPVCCHLGVSCYIHHRL